MERVPRATKSKLKGVLLNETGQMSIFVALIFQVLFVFFAMVVNVGLLVHDKINLQNAVDLAAYYAAERQAEILNEIAHINYQIRQDYKLLVWRYRVLGTLGRQGITNPPSEGSLPPARKNNPGSLSDKAWVNPDYGDEPPSVCVANDMWWDFVEKSNQDENYCFQRYLSPVPKIPDVVEIAGGIVPQVGESAGFTKMAQQAQQVACEQAGPLDWAFTMQMIYAYKLSVATRKELIWELRKNLVSGNPKDQNNIAIKTGALATLMKNLTSSNREGFQSTDFQVVNSMADPNCAKDEGEFALPEVRIVPSLLFTNFFNCGNGSTSRMQDHHDTSDLDGGELAKWDPDNLMRNLAKGEPEPTNPFHSSLGFEKNPWCMSYMGVKAVTRTSKPFAPFGTPIRLEARAFAQPFGGRVGPWYKSRWTHGDGISSGDRVDPLTSPRLLPGGGSPDDADPKKRFPNYSRFPGDTLGLTSEITMGAQSSIIKSYRPADKNGRLHLQWYANFKDIPTNGDVAVQNGGPDFPLRRAEISAVAPDLYDITYYSVDPNYPDAYTAVVAPGRFAQAAPVFGQAPQQIPDVGGRLDNDDQKRFSVDMQIQTASSAFDPAVSPKLYYAVRDWKHLLTGWVQQAVQNFEFPKERFGKCEKPASPKLQIPGGCWSNGGRVGYSVRLISRSHLVGSWKVGGEGEAAQQILNPPPAGF